MDFSEFPEDVIGRILSFLPGKEAVAAAVLSRKLNRVSSSYLLYFNQLSFRSNRSATRDFMGYVDHFVSKFCCHNVDNEGKVFILSMDQIFDPSRIDRWLQLTSETNFSELYLRFGRQPPYPLPRTVFGSNSLTRLHLSWCDLQGDILNRSTILNCLQELYLERICSSGNVFKCLVSSCPSLTNFCLKNCSVVPDANTVNQRIEFDVPSLRTFRYWRSSYPEMVCEVDVSACRNLEILHYNTSRFPLPQGLSEDPCSNFPLLKTLSLGVCDDLKVFKISSGTLERLTLFHRLKPSKVTIDAPSLQSVKYACDEATADASWFLKLRASLWKIKQESITLSLKISNEAIFDRKELRDIPIPPIRRVKHLKLTVGSYFHYKDLVDGLLWSCHPETLSMSLDSGNCRSRNSLFIHELQGVCEAHVSRKKKAGCCKSTPIRCWRHYLKHAETERFVGTNYRKDLIERQKIKFKFYWYDGDESRQVAKAEAVKMNRNQR